MSHFVTGDMPYPEYKMCQESLALREWGEKYLRPAFVDRARQFFFEETGVKTSTLVWFDGAYRAMPKCSSAS
jgi:hypothetical protein